MIRNPVLFINEKVLAGTSGSLLYVNSSNALAQDNANLFYDATNVRLGIGTNAPSSNLHVLSASNPAVLFSNTTATATTAGLNMPTAVVDDNTVGTISWTNITQVLSDDGTPTSAINMVSSTSHYIKVTNYGFTLPGTATITGIEVSVKKDTNNASVTFDNSVKLVKANVISGNNNASASAWNGLAQISTYGGSSDLWGLSWTYTDINDSTFGVAFSAKSVGGTASPSVYYIKVKIYYNVGPVTWLFGSNSSNNKYFQISQNSSFGTNDYFILDGSGDLTITGYMQSTTHYLTEQASAPSSPSSGLGVVYEKTDKNLYFQDSTGAITQLTGNAVGRMVCNYVTGDFSTSSTTFVAVTGLSFTIAANEVWSFQSLLSTNVNTGSAGLKLGVVLPGTATMEVIGFGSLGANTSNRFDRLTTSASVGGSTNGTTAYNTVAADGFATVSGTVFAGSNSGTVQIVMLKVTSNTATAYKGSSMVATRIV